MATNGEIIETAQRCLLSNYRQAPLVLARGRGAEVWDIEGRRFIDLYGGIAVSALGHGHPRLVQAIADQARELIHTTNLVYNEPAVRLAQKLTALTARQPGGAPVLSRAFFCNSGTEAIEACVKLARRAAFVKSEHGRTRFLAFHQAFHGRTMGALPLTGTPKYWEGFACDTPSVTHLAYGDVGAVTQALANEKGRQYAAIVVEPVQGEGGVIPAPAGFLPALRRLATEAGALLIVDEIQTGCGRTGHWFGFQKEAVAPDLVALAKGLGGGVPIGAMLVREELNGVLSPGTHGSTFGGNPLATAAALAVLETIEKDGLVQRAARLGERLSEQLGQLVQRHPSVLEAERGAGLLRGIVLRQGVEARTLLGAARERGVLCSLATDRVLRITPPLIIDEALLDEAVAQIDLALEAMEPAPVAYSLEATIPTG